MKSISRRAPLNFAALSAEKNERQKLERMKHIDWEWYRVYGLGLVGQYQGIVFKNYEVKDLTQFYNTLDSSYLRYGVDGEGELLE